jgi:hypothetical protein
MILKTYARAFTTNLDASLAVLKQLLGQEPDVRLEFGDLVVVLIGDFCLIAGPTDSISPLFGRVGPVIVDDLVATRTALLQAGAEISMPITAQVTGQNMYSRNADGLLIEWLQFKPELWKRISQPVSAD